jgi:riboflavin synthase
MFTGLVEGIGEVCGVRTRGGVRDLRIRSPFPQEDLTEGASIAVQGVCLTLVESGTADGAFRVQAVPETLRRTTVGRLRVGDAVHLERALRADSRLGGHFVQGHIDGLGRIRRARREQGETTLDIMIPSRLARYVVEKGSIAIDGVSLTVGRKGVGWMRVHIIPKTVGATLLGSYRVGRKVNLEVDLLAKYAESLLAPIRASENDSQEDA